MIKSVILYTGIHFWYCQALDFFWIVKSAGGDVMSGCVFTDATAAMLCYYGMYHVLCDMSLTSDQCSTAAAVMTDARDVCVKAGVILYDLPVSVRRSLGLDAE